MGGSRAQVDLVEATLMRAYVRSGWTVLTARPDDTGRAWLPCLPVRDVPCRVG